MTGDKLTWNHPKYESCQASLKRISLILCEQDDKGEFEDQYRFDLCTNGIHRKKKKQLVIFSCETKRLLESK